MALISPGVEVTVIDESNYIPAATNSVPYILVLLLKLNLSYLYLLVQIYKK